MTLTAISGQNAKRPLSINSSTLAAVEHIPAGVHASKELMSFADRIRGKGLPFEVADWGLDSQTVISNLTNAGSILHAMAHVFTDDVVSTVYVNPIAFQAIITSEPFTEPGKTEPVQHALLDIEGYGRLQTRMPVAKLEAFLADVTRMKPNLMKITPDQARSRISNAGYILFDADQVESIHPNGKNSIDINLFGAAMMGNGRIDFHLNTGSRSGNLTSDVATRMFKKWKGLLKKDMKEPATMDQLSWRAQEYADKATLKLMASFAAGVAAQSPNIVKVPHLKEPNYVNPSRVAFAYAADARAGFIFIQPAYRNQPGELVVDFKTNDDAIQALNHVQNSLTGKPAP